MARKKKKDRSYQALARRYRPQSFDEVVGQRSATETLKNAIAQGRIGHAYLFAGPRGVGKTSTARILAKALNCEKGPTPEPCNKCDACRSIAGGEDLDVIEIDAASHTGVDDVRALRDSAQYSTGRWKYKIFIIDEVHRLSGPAFDALLKILEEPPPHVKFIFATTEPHRLPETVRSRCQRFDFGRVPVSAIVAKLEEVAAEEKIACEPPALRSIARIAKGSLRDAESLLDQLVSYAGDEKITAGHVEELTGAFSSERLAEVLFACAEGNTGEALEKTERFIEAGADPVELADQFTEVLRDALYAGTCGTESNTLVERGADTAVAAKIAASMGTDGLLYAINLLSSAAKAGRTALNPSTVVIVTVARMSKFHELVTLSELASMFVGGSPPQKTESPAHRSSASNVEVEASGRAAGGQRSRKPVESPPATGATSKQQDERSFPEGWKDLLGELQKKRNTATVASFLGKAASASLSDDTLTVVFSPEHSFHAEQVDNSHRRRALEEAARRVWGKKFRVAVSTSGEARRAAGPEQGRRAAGAGGGPRRAEKRIEDNPVVASLLDELDAKVLDVGEE